MMRALPTLLAIAGLGVASVDATPAPTLPAYPPPRPAFADADDLVRAEAKRQRKAAQRMAAR